MKTTFIYALCEPGTRTVRYIGKTCDVTRRLKEHLKPKKRVTHLGNWLRSLFSLGERPNLIVLREVLGDGSEAEMRYIRLARGCQMRLVNSTDGGDGGLNPSPEVRAKMSAANSGDKHYLFGKTGKDTPSFGLVRSPEARARMSEAQSGEKSHMFGKTGEACHNFGAVHSLETRAKRSAALAGEKNHQFGKTGKDSPNFGKACSQKTRDKISASKKVASALRKIQDQEIEWALAPYTLE